MATERDRYKTGRLTARPAEPTGTREAKTGEQALGLNSGKDDLLYVPKQYSSSHPAGLALMLHGAGARAVQGLSLLRRYADDKNMILLAPASRSYSWDIIASKSFGQDVSCIDQALSLVFQRYSIDPKRVAIGGFSDGASYALCLGLTNGDLFTHIIAFSPGFAYTQERHGSPAVFVSHGIHDQVLPIDPCGRRIVPQLQRQGIAVSYAEFDGAHEIPAHIADRAVDWFVGKSA